MATYHTEGIVKDVELTANDGSFRLEASASYAIEAKNGDKIDKYILFVEDVNDNQTSVFSQKVNGTSSKGKNEPVSCCRTAFLAPSKSLFSFKQNKQPIDTASLLVLMQNRIRIQIIVEGDLDIGTSIKGNKFIVSTIKVK